MNYLAHAVRFLERPWFVAGTAAPDWLSAADRRVRLRPKHVEPWRDDADPRLAELAAGVCQHLHDDGWFHATRGFAEVTAELAQMFRQAIGSGDGFRCGFLGHIVTEMLIDAVLIDEAPERLTEYYAALDTVEPELVEQSVNRMSAVPTERLAVFVRLFQRERILFDYRQSSRLWVRLNQVLRRVKLMPLPDTAIRVLDDGRQLIRERLPDLLPAEHFDSARFASRPLAPAPGERGRGAGASVS
jgi:hypothetical protein